MKTPIKSRKKKTHILSGILVLIIIVLAMVPVCWFVLRKKGASYGVEDDDDFGEAGPGQVAGGEAGGEDENVPLSPAGSQGGGNGNNDILWHKILVRRLKIVK